MSNEAAGYAALIARLPPLQMIDVRLLTTDGRQLVRTRYTEPDPSSTLLLKKMKLELPAAQPSSKITAGALAPPIPL